MSYFVIQNFFYLILASLIGVLTGWYLKKHIQQKRYQDEYLALERKRDDLNKRMSQAEEAMDRRYYLMTSENQKTQDLLTKSHSDNVVLSKKIKSLSLELDESKIASQSLQDELDHIKEDIGRLEEKNRLLGANNKRSKLGDFASKSQPNEPPTLHSTGKNTHPEKTKVLESLETEISVFKSENNELKKRIEEYTQQKLDVANITSQLKLANKERQRLLDFQTFGDEKNKRIEKLSDELTQSQTQLANKEIELSRYKNYLIDEEKKLIAEIEFNSEKLASSEQFSSELQKRNAENIETIKTLESDTKKLTLENSNLQAEIAKNGEELSALQQDHNKQKHQIEQLSAQIRRLTIKPENQ